MSLIADYQTTAEAAQRAGLFDDFRQAWESEIMASVIGKRRMVRASVLFMKLLTGGS